MSDNSQVFSHQIYTVRRLSEIYSRIIVLTGKKDDKSKLPENVTVVTLNWIRKQKLKNTFLLFYNFLKIILTNKIDLVFSHMTDTQSALISPITRILHIPHVLWYAHAKKSFYLRISAIFVDRIVTSTKGSCPIVNGKVLVIGQAINTDLFRFKSKISYNKKLMIHVGRLDPSKNIIELINLFSKLNLRYSELKLKLVGEVSSEVFSLYHSEVTRLARKLKNIELTGKVNQDSIPLMLSMSDIFIHMYQGSLDKALLEATLVGLPVLTTNLEYLNIFGQWSGQESSTLQDEYEFFQKLPHNRIQAECERRFNLAFRLHSYDQWQNKLVRIFEGIAK